MVHTVSICHITEYFASYTLESFHLSVINILGYEYMCISVQFLIVSVFNCTYIKSTLVVATPFFIKIILYREFILTDSVFLCLNNIIFIFHRHLRPSMMQQLLRRLVFDVPMLTEYCKIPIRVRHSFLVTTVLDSLGKRVMG